MSRKTLPYRVDDTCPKCYRKLYQCWIVGGKKPPRLAPDLWCAYCELNIQKEPQ